MFLILFLLCCYQLFRRSSDLDVEVAASGFTKDLAAKFDEAAEEFNILGGPDNPREEGDDDVSVSDDGEDENATDSDEETEINDKNDDSEITDNVPVIINKSDNVDEHGTAIIGEDETDGNIKNTEELSKECAELIDNKKDDIVNDKSNDSNNIKIDVGKEPDETKELDDDFDEMCDISGQNREYRPFRNEDSWAHVNSHLNKSGRNRSSNSMCSASTTSTIAPEVIRAKVKKQCKKQQEVLKARRIRKRGEAALQTKLRRETRLDIAQSTSSDWF